MANKKVYYDEDGVELDICITKDNLIEISIQRSLDHNYQIIDLTKQDVLDLIVDLNKLLESI